VRKIEKFALDGVQISILSKVRAGSYDEGTKEIEMAHGALR